jgi:hypothetical protein
MSTRAAIIIQRDSQFIGKYIHFDGYMSYTGNILYNYYSDNKTAQSLFDDNRYISTLSKNVNEIEYMKEGTVIIMDDFQKMVEIFKNMFCEYIYFYNDKKNIWETIYAI